MAKIGYLRPTYILKLAKLPTYNSIRFPCGTCDGSETISRSCKASHLAHGPDCPVCERQPAVEISGDGHEEAVLFVRHFGMPSRSAK
jgi:predicted RNA-binding Zn-ribbon protein involved in translation (DUF1610 family)